MTWPHVEAEHEHLALRMWNGDGAVKLLRAEPRRWAMLLERLGPTDLTAIPVMEGCETIGALIAQLDRPALAQLPPTAQTTDRWIETLRRGTASVPRRMTEQAASLLASLTSDHAPERLVNQDLHFANVLEGIRQPWVVIDPKPINGCPEFAVAPALWNRSDETAEAYNARAHLRLRLGLIVDAGGLDEDLAAAWTFVRVMINAMQGADHAPWVSRMVTIAKAMSK